MTIKNLLNMQEPIDEDETYRDRAIEIIRQVLAQRDKSDDLYKITADIYNALFCEPVIGCSKIFATIFNVLNNGVWFFKDGEDHHYKIAVDIFNALVKGGSNNMPTIETTKQEDAIDLAYDVINKWVDKLRLCLHDDDMHDMAMDIYNAIAHGSINDGVTFTTSDLGSNNPLGFGFTSKPNVKKAYYKEFMNTLFGIGSKPRIPKIDHIQLNGDITTVIWADGTHTIVKKAADEEYDINTALVYAIVKKISGNTSGSFNRYMNSLTEKIIAKRKKVH